MSIAKALKTDEGIARSSHFDLAAAPLKQHDVYTVTVDGKEQTVFTVLVDGGALAPPTTTDPCRQPTNASFVLLQLQRSQTAKVVVSLQQSDVRSQEAEAVLRPAPVCGPAPPIVRRADGKAGQPHWQFDVQVPGRWVLEIGGRFEQATLAAGLMIFAEYIDDSPPPEVAKSVTYFAPGVHRLPLQPSWHLDGEGRGMQLVNNSVVYLAPGAVVLGSLVGNYVSNVTVRGAGILAAAFLPKAAAPCTAATPATSCRNNCSASHGIFIDGGRNITIEGITIVQATNWNVFLKSASNVRIDRLKIVGWKIYNDGIDLSSSDDVVIADSFIRSDDDSVSIKGTDRNRNAENIIVRNSILFNQAHGNCMEVCAYCCVPLCPACMCLADTLLCHFVDRVRAQLRTSSQHHFRQQRVLAPKRKRGVNSQRWPSAGQRDPLHQHRSAHASVAKL